MALQPPIQSSAQPSAPLTPNMTPDLAPAAWQLWLVLALVIVAGLVRFVGVSNLSFYGDEETTAFAAVSVLDSGKPAVPSGMNYNRAPLYSYMAAAVASVVGENRELSFRLPSLVFGILSVWLMWLGTRRLLGVAIALVATVLLATSEWHASTSGYARMYAPYLALFMCTAYCFLEWFRTRSPAVLAIGLLLFLLSASFQILTVFVVALLLLPHFVARQLNYRQFWADAAIAVVFAGSAIYLDGVLVQDAYTDFAIAVTGTSKATALDNVALFWVPLLQAALAGWSSLVAGIALCACAVALWRFMPRVSLPWNTAVVSMSLIATLLMVLGQVYALVLCLYLLAVLATAQAMPVRYCLLASAVAVAVALVAAATEATNGYINHLTDPNAQVVFPYLAQLLVKYPLVVGAALLAPLLVGHRFGVDSMARFVHGHSFSAQLIRVLALFFVLNLFAFGIFGRWYEDRYIVHTYPFMLALTSYTLVVALDVLVLKVGKPVPVMAGCALALALLMPHHLVQGMYNGAFRQHGDVNIENGRYFPDHASVGRFVKSKLRPGDVVVATDVLQQRWYVGQADYWLRSAKDAGIYLYEDKTGRIRDIYVNAELLNAETTVELLQGNKRVWLIISSIDVEEDWAFSPAEREFVQTVKAAGPALYQGRDGRAEVYLLGGDA